MTPSLLLLAIAESISLYTGPHPEATAVYQHWITACLCSELPLYARKLIIQFLLGHQHVVPSRAAASIPLSEGR
jgi:hypothetical protein